MLSSESIWLRDAEPLHPAPRSHHRADVVIVGGGLTGIQAAYLLAKAGANVILLERRFLGSGSSGHSTAKVTASHGLVYSAIEKRWGHGVLQAYGHLQSHALASISSLVNELGLECQWTPQTAYLTADAAQDMKRLEAEAASQQRAGLNVSLTDGSGAPIPVLGMLMAPSQASFDPVRYIRGLARAAEARGAIIYEGAPVTRVVPDGVYLKDLKIKASYVLLCTRYPLADFPGGYCFRLTQRLGWVAALENTTPFDGLFKRAAPEGYSLRRAHGYTLLGGFDVKCGSRPAYPFERHLDHMAQHMFPGCKSISLWQGEDCFTADHLPYVGPISPKAPSVLIAAGFQKWGMTNSYAAAEAMTRHVLGAPLDESEILLPQRPHLGSLPPLAARNMETAVSYAKGILRFNRPRCPHMGCRLVYRNASNVWECPCHGSRFSTLGQVINTPAKSQTSTRLRQRPRH